MGFGLNISDLTPFLNKLNKNELKLENILDEDAIIDDIRNNNDCQFISFFTNENIKKLIDYSTKLPTSNSPKIGYKYPFNATEILCSVNIQFQNKLMTETPIIEKDNNTSPFGVLTRHDFGCELKLIKWITDDETHKQNFKKLGIKVQK